MEGQPDDQPFDFDPGERMTPEASRDLLAAQIRQWQLSGLETFAPKDLRDVMARTGMSRAWVQGRLREYLDDETGPVWRDSTDMSGVYRLRRLEPVPA
jgi:hypothetical protein